MRAGDLDRRVTIMRAVHTGTDEFNAPVHEWTDLGTFCGSKHDISDSERIRAQEVSAEITTRFQIRYSSLVADVNTKDQVRCEGKTYAISAVKEIGRREGIEITAAARAD